jgi:hypothetical protein
MFSWALKVAFLLLLLYDVLLPTKCLYWKQAKFFVGMPFKGRKHEVTNGQICIFSKKTIMDFIYLVIFEFLLHKQTAIW